MKDAVTRLDTILLAKVSVTIAVQNQFEVILN